MKESSHLRSSSVGAAPRINPLNRSRAQSSQPAPLEVRCGCQFFQSDSLLPERVNPIGSRPSSRIGGGQSDVTSATSKNNIIDELEENLSGSLLSFGVVTTTDYYAETNTLSRPTSHEEIPSFHNEHPSERISLQQSTYSQFSLPKNTVPTFEIDRPSLLQKYKPVMNTEHYNVVSTSRPLQPTATPVEPIAPVVNRQTKPEFSSQKSLDRYSQSTMLNRYRAKSQVPSLQNSNVDIRKMPKPEPIEAIEPIAPIVNRLTKPEFSSQRSLDRYSQSAMLNRYRPKSKSQAPSLQGSNVDIRLMPKITKTVSFDYGRPLVSAENGNAHQNYPVSSYMEADQYHRMTPMNFPVKERLEKLRMSDNR